MDYYNHYNMVFNNDLVSYLPDHYLFDSEGIIRTLDDFESLNHFDFGETLIGKINGLFVFKHFREGYLLYPSEKMKEEVNNLIIDYKENPYFKKYTFKK